MHTAHTDQNPSEERLRKVPRPPLQRRESDSQLSACRFYEALVMCRDMASRQAQQASPGCPPALHTVFKPHSQPAVLDARPRSAAALHRRPRTRLCSQAAGVVAAVSRGFPRTRAQRQVAGAVAGAGISFTNRCSVHILKIY